MPGQQTASYIMKVTEKSQMKLFHHESIDATDFGYQYFWIVILALFNDIISVFKYWYSKSKINGIYLKVEKKISQ